MTVLYVYSPTLPEDVQLSLCAVDETIIPRLPAEDRPWSLPLVAVRYEYDPTGLTPLFDRWPIFTHLNGTVCATVNPSLNNAVQEADMWLNASDVLTTGMQTSRARSFITTMRHIATFTRVHADWRMRETKEQ